MKVFRNKKTGRIGETQFNDDTEVLIKNAKQYYPDSEIEIIDMTPQEYKNDISIQDENDKSPNTKREDKIKKEMIKINRVQAITNLRARGEIK